MSLILISKIVITQQPTNAYPDRSEVYTLTTVNSCEIESSWMNLTSTAHLVFPKNIYVKSSTDKRAWKLQSMYITPPADDGTIAAGTSGNKIADAIDAANNAVSNALTTAVSGVNSAINKVVNTLTNTNTAATQTPIFLRGDKITISLGYAYQPPASSSNPFTSVADQVRTMIDNGVVNSDGYVPVLNPEFEGYITKINPRMPLEIWCEDNMWLLKQAQCPNMTFPADEKGAQGVLSSLLKSIITPKDPDDPNYTYITETIVKALKNFKIQNGFGTSTIPTNIGDFTTQNQTIAQVLDSWRNDYKLECFFRGNDLYLSPIVYNPTDFTINGQLSSFVYDFQNNIISDDLTYLRSDDLRVGIHAYSVYPTKTGDQNITQSVRAEVTIGDTDGELRTQYFWPPSNAIQLTQQQVEAQLTTQAMLYLNKLKYDGWQGSFISFGLPFVRHGQAVTLKDAVIPERNGGTYLVKSVKVNFSVDGGFRREIGLHFKLNTDSDSLQSYQNGL